MKRRVQNIPLCEQVHELDSKGFGTTEIALQLGVSISIVRAYRKRRNCNERE